MSSELSPIQNPFVVFPLPCVMNTHIETYSVLFTYKRNTSSFLPIVQAV